MGMLCLILALLVPRAAECEGLETWAELGHYRIEPGTFDLGIDVMFVYRGLSGPEREGNNMIESSLFLMSGVSPRYFPTSKLALGLNLNLFYQSMDSGRAQNDGSRFQTSDVGFLGLVTAEHYLRLGRSFYLAPGLGLGGFSGKRSTDGGETSLDGESRLAGFASRIELSMVYYATARLNVRGGPGILVRIGRETPDDTAVEPFDFVSLDVALLVGIGCSF